MSESRAREKCEWVGSRLFRFRDIVPQLFNITLRRRFKFDFELVPYEAENLTLKKVANFFVHGLNQFLAPSKPLGVPVIAQIEPTNVCNLSCPLCYTASSELPSRAPETLSFETFKEFVDEVGDYLLLIVLWNWGEPFLNPEIYRFIEYAKTKNILIHTSTNGNFAKFGREEAERLVDSGLDTLIVAVDGASQETYSQYRRGGNLECVLDNIKTILETRRKKGAVTPRLNLRYLVTRQNEHEIPIIKRIAQELDVDFLSFKAISMINPLGEFLDEHYTPEERKYCQYEYHGDTHYRKTRSFSCMRPWKRITLQAGGEIVSCEFDYKNLHKFGNINGDGSVKAVWRGEAARAFRKRFNFGLNDYYFCEECVFKNMVTSDCVFEVNRLQGEARVERPRPG